MIIEQPKVFKEYEKERRVPLEENQLPNGLS
jgi:hypothetical protein